MEKFNDVWWFKLVKQTCDNKKKDQTDYIKLRQSGNWKI